MGTFIVRRAVQALGLVIGLSIVTFLILDLAPGDPFASGEGRSSLSWETRQAWRQQWGGDQPVWVRYGRWLARVADGQLGYSIEYRMPVSELLGARLGATLLLTLAASVIAWGIGLPLGVFVALRARPWSDRAHRLFVTAALTMPRFVLALLALLFASATGWFPLGGMRSSSLEMASSPDRLLDVLHHLALPALVLSLHPLAVISSQTRSVLREALVAEFVRAASAKGVSRAALLWRHALRPALAPLLVLLGYSIGNLLSGSALVETVLAWPGLGQLVVQAVFARDADVILAAVLLSAALLIVGNALADLLLMANDPRARVEV